ncbi:MAG: hypothetical protein A2104_06940 [Candidatus Melainabacteria bacterium GWF2_32_7]|nr:MAG: hypothetical protein A2104_06940 [Candidatus Melainabacteria bacterium GWF2_32_7]
MKKDIINSLSIKEKLAQMFIMGFSGFELVQENLNIQKAVKMGLGGIIFFANNIKSIEQTSNLSKSLQNMAKIPLFISIDQEGGLVERTINCKEKLEYLTPMALCSTGKVENVKAHTEIMAQELRAMNINMDFAPVLDVNTNKNNPIIGIRAFSNDPEKVIKYSEAVYKTLKENNIMAVGKHFPGHGEAWADSHLEMPAINLDFNELEKIHIKPFKKAVENGLYAIMVAHVHYSAFNQTEKIPASLSKEVVTGYLKDKLGFEGLIISDDMAMGGITRHYEELTACIKAINAGIDLLIFRDSMNIQLLDKLADAVGDGLISEEKINQSVGKILSSKEKYNIIDGLNQEIENLDITKEQIKIDSIALESIKIEKKGDLIPLNKANKVLILSPDKSQIHSYAQDRQKISDFLKLTSCKEVSYSLNPDDIEIQQIKEEIKSSDIVIFISYNAILNQRQIELFKEINKPVIAIAAGIPYDAEKFQKADTILLSFGYKTPALKALASIISG